jgi:hypothetical protein
MAGERQLERGIYPGLKKQTSTLMDFVRDLFSFLKERKKWWLTPIILLLLFVGVLIVIGGSSAVAPFIYTLF